MKRLTLILYLIYITSQNCKAGCLLCSSNGNECLYCDKNEKYYRVGSLCTEKNLENCIDTDNGEKCQICIENYYPDYKKGKCYTVDKDNTIENCQFYKFLNECDTCEDEYYLDSNRCLKIENKIENCKVYQNSKTCKQCIQDKRLSENKDACLEMPDENCMTVGDLRCQVCNEGYSVYDNAYLYNYSQWTSDQKKKADIYNLTGEYYNICAPLNIENCIKFKNFYQCEECDVGYFLTLEKECQLLPEEPIENCFEYKKKNHCRLCLDGYYLFSISECLPHDKEVELCRVMSNLQKDTCSECESGYFLDNNTCTKRSLSISGCLTLSSESDTCEVCESNFLANEGNTKCLDKIENCFLYFKGANELVCNECVAGYYWNSNDNRCSLVLIIEGCNTYENLPTGEVDAEGRTYKCKECQTGYYKLGNECLAHDDYTSKALYCLEWSLTEKNVCDKCDTKEVKLPVLNYCEEVPIQKYDENVLYYTYDASAEFNGPVSDICKTGFYLEVARKKCFKIATNYCDIYENTRCQKCSSSSLENYFPNHVDVLNKCILSYFFAIQNCKESDNVLTVDLINYNICDNCYSPYYPEEFKEAKFCIPKNKIEKNYEETKNINDCKIYKPQEDICIECLFDTEFLKVIKDGKCESECASYEVIVTGREQFFVCAEIKTAPYGCKRVVEKITGTEEDPIFNYYCAECAATFLPKYQSVVEDNFKYYDNYSYLPAKNTQHFKAKTLSYKSVYNRVPLYDNCLEIENIEGMVFDSNKVLGLTYGENGYIPKQTNYASDSSFWSSCKSIKEETINDAIRKFCIMCKFGFSGFYVLASSFTNNANQLIEHFMIPECRIMEECDYGIYYNGLGLNLTLTTEFPSRSEFYTSCHKCTSSDKIPTFSTQRIGTKKLNEETGLYETLTQPPGYADNNFYQQTFCSKPGHIDTNPEFPINCGIQEIKPTSPFLQYSSEIADFNPECKACKPGYKAIYETNLILNCEEITNCDPDFGMTTFNKCLKCKSGFVLDELNENCTELAIENCYKGNATECESCEKGYAPARDKLSCVVVNIGNCIDSDYFRFDPDDAALPYLGKGCDECDLGYLAVIFKEKKKVCVKSKEIEIRDYDRLGVENCNLYATDKSCTGCSVGFVLPLGVDNLCILSSTIENCEIYNSDTTCNKCMDSFFLSNNKCINGSNYISNCLQFTSETQCNECEDLYVKITNNERIECYYAGNSLKRCRIFNQVVSLTGQLTCTQCDNNYYPNDLTLSTEVCTEIPAIKNCKLYNDEKLCIECYENYWLSPPQLQNQIQSCVERTNYPYKACEIVNLNSDSCEQCNNGYYVRNNNCAFKPTGVFGCAIYLDSKTCLKCKDNQFILANVCRIVPPENLIEKCIYYKDENTCSDCEKGYLLLENKCKAILISDCEIYETENQCKICKSQYFLTELKTCQAGAVQNCIVHASLNSCQTCVTLSYVNDQKTCTQVEEVNKINNCKIYKTHETCELCTNQTILSKDGKSCLSFSNIEVSNPLYLEKDNNCDSYLRQVHCKVCKSGFKFSGGKCVKCSSNLPNCHFCDYKDDNICHVCQSGSFQNEKFQCISFTNLEENEINEDGQEADEIVLEGCGRFRGFFVFFLVFMGF